MPCDEILNAVFPLLEGADLAKCMVVSKQWREIAQDDYFWKCLCSKTWPSIVKRPQPPTVTYRKLFQTFYKRQHRRTLLPPGLSLNDLEFYVDIWTDDRLIFSEVVPGPTLHTGICIAPPGVSDVLKDYLEAPEYKMILPVEPRLTIPSGHSVTVSVLIGRNDSNKVACIIDKSVFDYIDGRAYRARAFNYLDFAPSHPFVPTMRVWFSLLFLDNGNNEGTIDVFGIDLDFSDAANSEEEILWLLDMLDWK